MDPSITMKYRTDVVRQIDLLVLRNEREVCSKTSRSFIKKTVIAWEFDLYKQHRNNKQEYDAKVETKRQMLEERLANIKHQQKILCYMYPQIRFITTECKECFTLLAVTMPIAELNQYKRTFNGYVRRFRALYYEKIPNDTIKTRLYAIYLEFKLFKVKINTLMDRICLQLQINLVDLLNMDKNEAFHRVAGLVQNKKTRLM